MAPERNEGDVVICAPRTPRGVVTGRVTVGCGGAVALVGMVWGDLVVLPGGRCRLEGLVWGDVVNRGGELTVFGAVHGRLIDAGGTTVVDPLAAIAGGARAGYDRQMAMSRASA